MDKAKHYCLRGNTNIRHIMRRESEDNLPRMLHEAMKLVSERRAVEAETVLKRLLKTQPNCSDALWLLGRALTQQDRFEESIDAYQKAAQLEPDRAVFHESLGVLFIRMGEIAEGRTALTRAMNLDRESLRPSEYTFGKLIESDRENALLWYGLGVVLEIQDKIDMSAKAMSIARQLDSTLESDPNGNQES
ncbi:MAG: tetratricopeptide repeat protein [Candidatus Sifarchaeia archaeon]